MKPPTPLERAASRLSMMLTFATVNRYAWAPIPAGEDVLVRELLEELTSSAEQPPDLPGHVRSILFGFAIRSASRAVRENQPANIQAALDALRFASERTDDPRDLVDPIVILYDASRRMGLDVRFALANGGEEGSPLARAISTVLALPQNEVSIEKYGFVASSDAQGFRYAPPA